MKIISVVGARPNFMKIAPFIKAINEYNSLPHPLAPSPIGEGEKGAGGEGGEVWNLEQFIFVNL